MITKATCLWCQEPIKLTVNGWVHRDGHGYAKDGHQAMPNRNKPPYTERKGRACSRALPSGGGRRRTKPQPIP